MTRRLTAAAAALVAALGVVACGGAAPPHGQQQDVRNAAASGGKHRSASVSKDQVAGESALSSPSPTPSPSPPAVTAGMQLVFHQDFTGPLDSSVWDTCYPWAGSAGCTNFSNPEDEWYVPSQVQVSGGALHLVAQMEPTEGTTQSGQPAQYSCRSGMVTSYPGFHFEYGYVNIVAQVPFGTDLWSGLWLAAANLQWPPEIDLLESYGPPVSKAIATFHPVNAPFTEIQLPTAQFASLASGWHSFSLLWTPQKLVWYVDNLPISTVAANIPDQMMYLIANLADYSGAGPQAGSCNGQLVIRSVDVWQNP